MPRTSTHPALPDSAEAPGQSASAGRCGGPAAGQQWAFNHFRTEYNQEYPGHFLVKKITTGGTFRFQHRLLFPAHSLTDHHIGPEETDDGIAG